ncbi:putative ribonuclease H-like domain-containing protein [Tanacetum coccineum]
MRTKPEVDSHSFDDLYNNLRVFESNVKGSTRSSSSAQNVAFVSSQSTNSIYDVSTAYGVSTSSGYNSQRENSSSYTVELISKGNQDIRRRDVMNTGYKAKDNKQEEPKALLTLDGDGVDWIGHAEDKFAKVEGMHAVPPLMTGNYMSPKSNFRIDESQFTYGLKQSKTSESDANTSNFKSCESNSSVETLEFVSEPVVNEPKVVSQPKVWSDAPIIEEYESNSDDDCVIKPSIEQEKPSFTFVNTVKHVKTPRETVKEQNTCSQSPKVDKRDWNGLMSKKLGFRYGFTRKACFVCGSFGHLIRDCDFHEKRMVKQVKLNKQNSKGTSQGENRPVWNNVQRLNHQNKFVLTPVLTRTGTFLVNTARHNCISQAVSTSAARKVNAVRPIVNDDNPQRALKNKGTVDSGCSRAGKFDFKDVHFVNELQHFNLFSVSQMCDKKNKVLFTDTKCLVLSPDFKLPDESQVLLKVPRQNNMYSFNLENIVLARCLACLVAKAIVDESNKWHRRLGHVNFKNINKLVKGNFVRGLPSKISQDDHTCVACQNGKQHKASCKAKLVSSISLALQLLHKDLFGPTSIRSVNHKTYCLVITDDFSREMITSQLQGKLLLYNELVENMKIKIKDDKAKGVAFKDTEESDKHARSILTLKPLLTIDPKDKGKSVLKEPKPKKKITRSDFDAAQIARDEEVTRQLEVELQAEEKYTVDKRVKLLAEFFKKKKKQLAEERAATIKNKPPTRTQLRSLMMTYLKHTDFVPIRSVEDERRIEEMNKKAVAEDTSKKQEVLKEHDSTKIGSINKKDVGESSKKGTYVSKKRKRGPRMKRQSKRKKTDSDLEEEENLKTFLKIVPDEEGIIYYEVLEKRSDGSSRWIKTFSEMVTRFDRLDLVELYNLVMQRFETTTLKGVDLVLWGDLRTMFDVNAEDEVWQSQERWNLKSWDLYKNYGVYTLILEDGTKIHMLAERKYPLTKETLKRMLSLRLVARTASEDACNLLRFIQKQIDEYGSHNGDIKNWLVKSKQLLELSSPKQMALALAIPEQTTTVVKAKLLLDFSTLREASPAPIHNIYSFYEFESSESDAENVDIETLTIEQYLALDLNNVRRKFTCPNDSTFEVKGQLLRELCKISFSGGLTDSDVEHISNVLEIASIFNAQDSTLIQVFPLTLEGIAKRWFERTLTECMKSWSYLKQNSI